jgi:hypothetical protein
VVALPVVVVALPVVVVALSPVAFWAIAGAATLAGPTVAAAIPNAATIAIATKNIFEFISLWVTLDNYIKVS